MPTSFETMISLQTQLFLLMAAGFVLTRCGVITAAGRKSLSSLLISFILPCSIIKSFQLDLGDGFLSSCAVILALSFGVQAFYLLLSKIAFPGAPRPRLACLRYATVCSNAGFLGIPICGGVYGEMGALLTSILLVPQRIVMWSAGVSLFTDTNARDVVKKVLTHPCIVAVVIGFALMLTGNPELPDVLQKTLNSVSGCNTSISMIVIGSILAGAAHIDLRDRMLWWYSLLRLLLIPIAVLLMLAALPVDPIVWGVMVLNSGMPAGSTTAILAQQYDGDAAFASCLIFLSTLLSMLTLPLLCLFL